MVLIPTAVTVGLAFLSFFLRIASRLSRAESAFGLDDLVITVAAVCCERL